MSLGRVFKIPWPVLRRDKASGFVARRSKIHEGYSPPRASPSALSRSRSLSQGILKTRPKDRRGKMRSKIVLFAGHSRIMLRGVVPTPCDGRRPIAAFRIVAWC